MNKCVNVSTDSHTLIEEIFDKSWISDKTSSQGYKLETKFIKIVQFLLISRPDLAMDDLKYSFLCLFGIINCI